MICKTLQCLSYYNAILLLPYSKHSIVGEDTLSRSNYAMLVLDAKRGHLMHYLFKMQKKEKEKFNTGQRIMYECKTS